MNAVESNVNDSESEIGTFSGRGNLSGLKDYTPVGSRPFEDDDRAREQQEKYDLLGFDDRSLWSLDFTMIELLYERLIEYKEVAVQVTHMDAHGFDTSQILGVPEDEMTQAEIIDRILELSKEFLEDNYLECRVDQRVIWELWAVSSGSMWY